jgi:hypothetical protein
LTLNQLVGGSIPPWRTNKNPVSQRGFLFYIVF